jgi:putative CocE/NonD family hydrolase
MPSEPQYEVMLARDVGMTARDGVHLATDVWRPARDGEPLPGPFPAVMIRTPYNRTGDRYIREGAFWASRGYLFVVQDCRGRFDSGGEFVLLANEGPDGYDAVEWAAELPYCDGNVGTYGTSYSGWVQNALAIERPPHLRAMWINQGGANGASSSLRHNGALELRWLTWAVTHGAATVARDDPALAERLRRQGLEMFDWLYRLPWSDETPLEGLPGYDQWARQLYEHGDAASEDGYWLQQGLNFEAYYDRTADVPTMYSGGWYDSYTRATTDNYVGLAPRLREQRLLMGPWTHGDLPLDRSYAGETELGADAAMTSNVEVFPGGSRQGELLRWFDCWLRDDDNGIRDASPVRLFVMGGGSGRRDEAGRIEHGGVWRDEETWPLARASSTPFYLQPGGALGREPASEAGGASTLRYDPEHPLPTVSANTSSLNQVLPTPERVTLPTPITLMRVMVIQGGADQRVREDTLRLDDFVGPLEEREDVLAFETEPLAEDLEATGPIEATIYLESDAPDTDLFVMVQDMYPPSDDWPEGFRLNVADGLMRARYRESFDHGVPLDGGKVAEVRFQLYPTSNRFVAGHRIRVLVSSSSFPRFDINPNTGEPIGRHTHTQVATNTIHHSREYPSRVELPLVPVEE